MSTLCGLFSGQETLAVSARESGTCEIFRPPLHLAQVTHGVYMLYMLLSMLLSNLL